MSTLQTRLQEVMAEMGLQKPRDLADFCGVSEGLVSQWFSGTTKLGPKPLRAFARTPYSLDWLSYGDLPKYRTEMATIRIADSGAEVSEVALPGIAPVVLIDDESSDFYLIPKVTLRLRAGFTGFQTDPDTTDGGKIGVPKNWADKRGYMPSQLLAIQVKGESMEPTLYDGDTVIINIADKKLVDNGVFAVNYDGEAVVKRLSRDAGQWWLLSDHPDQRKYYRRSCKGNECIVIGRIVRREGEFF